MILKIYALKDEVEQAYFVPQKTTPIFLGVSKGQEDEMLKTKRKEYLRKTIANGGLIRITEKYQWLSYGWTFLY